MPRGGFIILRETKEGDGVKTVIYADVLVAVNIYVTYFLIVAARLFLKKETKGLFVALASVLGGLSSLEVLLDVKSVAAGVVFKLAASAVITLIAFLPKSLSGFLKAYFAFFSVGFIFGGIMLFFEYTFHPEKVMFINGTVYFDVSVLFIVIMSLLGYGAVMLLDRLLKKRASQNTLYTVTVLFRGKKASFRALYDTGNNLSDGFDGRPVILTELSAVKELFCANEYCYLKENDFSFEPPESLLKYTRIIAGKSVCGSSLFWAFLPDKVYIKDGKTTCVTDFAAIAVTAVGLKEEEYSALLGNTIFERSKKTDETKV